MKKFLEIMARGAAVNNTRAYELQSICCGGTTTDGQELEFNALNLRDIAICSIIPKLVDGEDALPTSTIPHQVLLWFYPFCEDNGIRVKKCYRGNELYISIDGRQRSKLNKLCKDL